MHIDKRLNIDTISQKYIGIPWSCVKESTLTYPLSIHLQQDYKYCLADYTGFV